MEVDAAIQDERAVNLISTQVKTLNRYLRADLSPFCTHVIFFEHESDRLNFKAYLQRFLPHATTVPRCVEISEFGCRSDPTQ